MNNLEKIGSAMAVAAFIFGIGAGWNAVNARFDKLEGEVKRVDDEKGESLCLAVLSRQIVAIEKGKLSIQRQLQDLANRHCPKVPSPHGELVVAAHGPISKKRSDELRAADQKARKATLEKLGHIDRELRCSDLRASGRAPIHPDDPDYSVLTDRDGDGVGCE
jgi:hypothetical protein